MPGESYKLAFTPGLLDQVFQRPRRDSRPKPCCPTRAARARRHRPATGAATSTWTATTTGGFRPAGRSSPDADDAAADELAQARAHFFLPRRYRDPFGQDAFVDFDANDLLMVETRDALGNRVTVDANDYRVLQPRLVSDPNRNQTEVAFDTLGMVVGTAVMGKPLPAPVEGDSLTGFVADLTQAQLDAFFDAADPHATAPALLQDATTRIVYDLDRFRRTQQANPNDPTKWQPACAATLARETHVSAPLPPQGLKIQLSFSYSDGFGREIQKKIQAEPGPLVEGGPVVNPRWVGSGWTIFNNKGKPVRQYEPFFSATHRFEFGVQVGVSPVLFYDPAERVIATLHPNHTYEKVVFDPWQQTTYDVNDTCAPRNAQTGDPRTDPDIGGYVAEYFKALPAAPTWQTWHAQRIGGALGPHERGGRHARRSPCRHADHRALRRAGPPLPDRGAQPRRLRRPRPRRHRRQLRHPRRAGHRRQPARRARRRSQQAGDPLGAHRHALRLRHARQPHPPAQHGGRRALDAERRGRQAHPRLGQPRPQLHHHLRRAAPPGRADRARHHANGEAPTRAR